VRLTALNLREDPGVDSRVPGPDPGFSEITCFTCFSLSSKCHHLCVNYVDIRVLGCAEESLLITIPCYDSIFYLNSSTLLLYGITWFFRGAVGTSPGRSFLAPKFTYLPGLAMMAQKRETGSIESGGDPVVDSRFQNQILGFPEIHLFHVLLTFCFNVTFPCKFRRYSCSWMHRGILVDHYSCYDSIFYLIHQLCYLRNHVVVRFASPRDPEFVFLSIS